MGDFATFVRAPIDVPHELAGERLLDEARTSNFSDIAALKTLRIKRLDQVRLWRADWKFGQNTRRERLIGLLKTRWQSFGQRWA
ncbi:hypothetical protein ASF56_09895 [Methylobacterium sp. Leaf122]|nr:hypothetical protein ASF33_12570 [Methylobacterium sp. Leaf92]KQQ04726.1 hypothetical protein ASF56_09895 [Methylobacterium sp. Leaf122]